jgi:hypothetical protein
VATGLIEALVYFNPGGKEEKGETRIDCRKDL